MSKHRIYELAKEFNTTSKVIIDILARNNMTAKNHMSSVDDDARTVIERTFARKTNSAEQVPEKLVQNGVGHSAKQSVVHHPQSASGMQVSKPISPAMPRNGQSQHSNSSSQHGADGKSGQSFHKDQQRPQQQNQYNQQRPQQQNQQRPQQNQHQQNRPQQQNQYNQQRPQYGSQHKNQQPMVSNQQGQQRSAIQSNQPNHNPNRQFEQRSQQPNSERQSYNRTNAGPNQRPDQQSSRPQGSASNNQRSNERQQSAGNHKPQSGTGFNKRPQGQHGQGPNKQHQHRTQNTQHHPNARQAPQPAKIEPPKPKVIKLGESITVKDLAGKLGREVSEVIKKLMMLGIMASINQEVDLDTATLLAGEFGVEVEELPPEEDPTEIPEIEDDEASLVLRPPVVTVMGHVDHGKTSLLDSIRQTHVTAQEAGGITQHIGAYQVVSHGKRIVFLDTPGHEAFTAMRARGAQVTDIAILVVAADDGVMPQTIEAINHSKSAKVPIIVAINKMDRQGANPDRVKQQLSDHGLIPEDWGGDTIMVPVSAHNKTGINELLEMILLVAEMQEIKANPNRHAFGTIIEAQLDKGRGPVATVLVQKGTLHIGDSIIAGVAYGKVRAMVNDRGEKVKKAEPSTPVEVLGLTDVPQAGDILAAVDEKVARAVAEKRIAKKRTEDMQHSQKVSLDDLFKQIQEGNIKDLNIVIKADVQGSIEALRQALIALNENTKEVRVTIVHAGVGAINESDVMLASASNALIIGFNVRPDSNARKSAETEKIDIRTYRVIYEAINDVEAAMNGMLAPEYKEVIQGRVEIRKVFSIAKSVVAGSYVLEGKITNSSQIRLIRDGIVIHEGALESLRRFKDDVKEVAAGYECGISIEKFRDIKEGDIIEAFAMEEVKQSS